MKIAMGCDPNAADMKNNIIEYVKGLGHEVTDFGSEDPIYAKVAFAVGEAVADGKFERGILFCGTGLGVMLAANKVPGCYAAVVGDVYSAQRACLSNNCNVITIGAQVTGIKKAEMMVREYLSCTYVCNERSAAKVDAIVAYAKEHGQ